MDGRMKVIGRLSDVYSVLCCAANADMHWLAERMDKSDVHAGNVRQLGH